MKEGDVVVCEYGYNDILKRPFRFLYEYGYIGGTGKIIVYNQGERNMQDAHAFSKKQVRLATPEDIETLFWGN